MWYPRLSPLCSAMSQILPGSFSMIILITIGRPPALQRAQGPLLDVPENSSIPLVQGCVLLSLSRDRTRS